jgi:hypothetical protein
MNFVLDKNKQKFIYAKLIRDKLIKDKLIKDKLIKDKLIKDKLIKDKLLKDKLLKDKLIKTKNTEIYNLEHQNKLVIYTPIKAPLNIPLTIPRHILEPNNTFFNINKNDNNFFTIKESIDIFPENKTSLSTDSYKKLISLINKIIYNDDTNNKDYLNDFKLLKNFEKTVEFIPGNILEDGESTEIISDNTEIINDNSEISKPKQKNKFDFNKIKNIQEMEKNLSNKKEITTDMLLTKMNELVNKVKKRVEIEISKDMINYVDLTNPCSSDKLTSIICYILLDKIDLIVS